MFLLRSQVAASNGVDLNVFKTYAVHVHKSESVFTNGMKLMVPYIVLNWLQMIYISRDLEVSDLALESMVILQITKEVNQSLINTQQYLLTWHQKLSKVGYSYIFWLACKGYLSNKAKVLASGTMDY